MHGIVLLNELAKSMLEALVWGPIQSGGISGCWAEYLGQRLSLFWEQEEGGSPEDLCWQTKHQLSYVCACKM